MIHYFPNAKRWAHRAINTKEIHNIVSKIVSDAKYQVHLFHVGNLRKNFSQIQCTYVKNVKSKCLQVTTFVWSHPSPKALVTSLVAFIVVPLQETLETNIRGVPRWSRWCQKNSLATCSLLTQVVGHCENHQHDQLACYTSPFLKYSMTVLFCVSFSWRWRSLYIVDCVLLCSGLNGFTHGFISHCHFPHHIKN